MGIWSTIGKGIAKGAKFAFEHRKEIEEATTTVKDTASFVSEMSQRKKDSKSEKEYYAILEEENEKLRSAIPEISQGIAALEELYEGKIQELEEKADVTATEIASLKESTEESLRTLKKDLDKAVLAQANYRKIDERKFLGLAICSGIGIVIAVLLAIAL